jgi:hypothetical protein
VNGFQVLDLGTTAVATSGTGDIAIAFGANSTAIAEGGFGDYAFVFDPLGTVGSSAHAEGTFGLINNMDLAGVFGDMLHANATAGSNIIDITATPFG